MLGRLLPLPMTSNYLPKPMSPCQSSDIDNDRPTKRGFASSGDDACRRLVASADTHGNQEEEEMPPVKKMRHKSNESTDVVNELFSQQSIHSLSPLGLNLTKSPSFVELIQNKLALAAKVRRTQATENARYYGAMHSNSTATEGMKPSQKFQAARFQASFLRIGDWERKSRYQGDLVAKFYFAKRKVVWEILYEGLKSKIEMNFSDICGLRIRCPKDLPATLDIMVSVAPQFFRETYTQPYKGTRWFNTSDFTDGQATILRHVLQCDPGIMDKHIENLLSADHRLYLLSEESNINPESPFLGTFCSLPEMSVSSSHINSYGNDGDDLSGTEKAGESFPLHLIPMGTKKARLNHSGALQGVLSPGREETSGGTDQLKSGKFSWKKFFETTGVAQQPFVSNGGIMNGKGNHTNNLVNLENSHRRLNYSSPPEVIRSFPCDSEVIRRFHGDSMTNQQIESRSQSSHTDHAVVSPSSEELSGQRAPLNKALFNWRSFLQTPGETQPSSVSNAGIIHNDSENRFNNQMTSQTLSRSADSSSLPGEMTAWRSPDGWRTNQQFNLWNQPSYNHGQSNKNMIEQEIPQCEYNGSQTLPLNLSSNGNVSPDRMGLEQISQNLLSDDVVVNSVEERSLFCTVNSFSCLIEQAPAPSSQNPPSQASNTLAAPAAVEPTEVIGVDASESSGADDWLLARMNSPSFSWELSPEDMVELLP